MTFYKGSECKAFKLLKHNVTGMGGELQETQELWSSNFRWNRGSDDGLNYDPRDDL